jgi:tetratricopeptide (TPR) repeat protein
MVRRLAILLCLLPVTVWAAGSSPDMEKAAQLFKQMNYRGALKLAQRALKSAESEPDDLVSAYRITGLCLSALGRDSQAVQSFKKLLAIDPSFRLSRDISPKLTPPFKKALRLVENLDPISLVHQEPDSPGALAGLELKVTIQSDPFSMVSAVRLQYRVGGAWRQMKTAGVKAPSTVFVTLPEDLEGGAVAYYFEAQNRHGGILARAGSEAEPFRIEIHATRSIVAVETPPPVPDLSKAATDPTGSGTSRTSPDDHENGGTPWYQSWWFWTAVGVAVAGAATATVLVVGDTSSSGGPYYYDIQVE